MARKRNNNSDEGVNLDSLMDALTNVVAVLILVLILVQADVSQKVQQFIDDLQPATPEEIAISKQLVRNLELKRENLEDKLEEEPPTPQQIEEEKRQLALLEKDIEVNQELLANLDELRKLEAKIRPERDAEQARTVKVQQEIARLEALLDDSLKIKGPPPAVVTIPDSRPIPPTAQIYYAIVARNRIHLIDPFTPLELFEKEFNSNKNDWKLQRIKRKGADRIIYSQQKISAHFKDFDFKNSRNQTVSVITFPTADRLRIDIQPDLEKGGTPVEDLGKEGNAYANALAALSRNLKAVLMFKVHPDSFSTYLEARSMADEAKIPSGWEVDGAPSYRFMLPDIEVNRLKEPPKNKPSGPKPPVLKPKLD